MIKKGTTFGRFIVEEVVGSGSTGTVYRARAISGNAVVAIKVLSPHLASNSKLVTMFEEEAKAGLQLSHPNIVQTLYVGRHENQPYIVFEYVWGLTFGKMFQKGPLAEPQCLWVMRQLAQALRELRLKNMVHQDIKPDNIIIDGNGNAKLTDLGFARVPKGKINWTGVAAGTPLYMSPEQAYGSKEIDCRADIYSLGATMYHAATGTPPFTANSEEELMRMHVNKRADGALTRNPKLNADFAAILARMLEKDAKYRFHNPEELLLAIRFLNVAPAPLFTAGASAGSGSIAAAKVAVK